jgi:hypothetical protein
LHLGREVSVREHGDLITLVVHVPADQLAQNRSLAVADLADDERKPLPFFDDKTALEKAGVRLVGHVKVTGVRGGGEAVFAEAEEFIRLHILSL